MKSFMRKTKLQDYLFVLVVILKLIAFYWITQITRDSLLIGIITFFAVALSFYANLFSSRPKSWIRFAVSYSAISILMVIDACYYSYFNQMISMNQLFQVDKLIVVDESFKFVAPPIGVLLIIDVPFAIWYYKRLKKRISGIQYRKFLMHKRLLTICFYSLFLFIVFNPFKIDTVRAINRNEVLTYHVVDIVNNVFGEEDNVIRSKDDVLGVIQDNQSPITGEIQYNGAGAGKNLIVIQVESLQDFVLMKDYNGQELTPNLNQLLMESGSIYFDHYYETIGKGNTADAEFSSLNSIYPNLAGSVYEKYEENTFYGLPWLMRENGYYAKAYHGYKGEFWNREKAYVGQGFQDFMSEDDYQVTDTIGFGIVDHDMLQQSMDDLLTLQRPFFGFLITLSSHHPYLLPEKFSSLQLKEEDAGTVFGNYLQAIHYTDASLGAFFDRLKEEGLYENTVIALYGDHYALNCKNNEIYLQMSDYLGYSYEYDEMLNIPFILHIPGIDGSIVNHTTGGEVDFMPTLANIMGIQNNNPYIMGRDLLNSDEYGFVASVTYLFRGSFIKNGILFEFSEDGIYDDSRAWDITTRVPYEIQGLEDDYLLAKNVIDASRYILENNLIERPIIE